MSNNKHNMHTSKVYKTWCSMIARCNPDNKKDAKYYSEKENKTRKDKVIYFENISDSAKEASIFSKSIESEFLNDNKHVENVHASTFELEVPSYDLR